MIYKMSYDAPVGKLLLAEKDGALVGLWMEGQKYFLGSVKEDMEENRESAVLKQTVAWLERYFMGEKPQIKELPLAPVGSAFRKEIWEMLCEIPYGETTTYGELARKLAKKRGIEKMSAQAVGGAVGHNPISIVIPCHRVIGSDGGLRGYAGGIEKKRMLLEMEGVLAKGDGPAKS